MRYLFALIFTLTTSTTLAQDNIRTAIFAGGCFWCMEPPYDKLEGVLETTSGYSGGHVKNPSYDQVSAGNTGHAEVVRVKYDADKIGYEELLQVFWRNVDPLDAGGQFCDRGSQYRSAIFYGNEKEKKLAEASKEKVAKKLDGKIATEIVPVSKFYPAEKYHQDYYQRNPIRYKYYRFRCRRDQRLEEVWGG
ncbi:MULTISPECIES: peptide-methionine (S)-S-oxide reductase MsrA [unclassified Microbulbifer]|uniref:peptide-methionine (S)-S-oxide reductase MsrA n=1 Tax=unclassified Microbulbifer TaxID=2619833 RepID=UPI0027E3E364|nr:MULTISPECIES: peptide-methionine (S)-S-oxide reductase MsrA [unclassified Microbulbifer]